MDLAALIVGVIALFISIMALPTVFQMFWGRPKIIIGFSEIEGADGKRMICEISNAPIQSPVLRRLGVRREPALISADFGISEVGTNKLVVDTAQARLIDIGDDKPGSLHGTIPSHMPLLFTCLVHTKDDRVLTVGGLSGLQARALPVGRYFVHVRVTCGDAEFSRGREVMVGSKAPFTAWLGS